MLRAMSTNWKTLRLDDNNNNNGIPQLLIKAKLDSSGYTIHLTDLSQIWGETLTKRGIRKRADLDDCSIDPGEGDDQYQILLDKIQQALDQHDGTSLSLGTIKGVEGGLTVILSAPLPSPLPALKWQIQLSPLPSTALESLLIRPLLKHAQSGQTRIQSLLRELVEKDRVISKITDRLETSGNDLTTVFPGVSNIKISRKKSQREQLARHVRGLGDFDVNAWRAQHGVPQKNGVLLGREIDSLLTELPYGDADDAKYGEWWRELGHGMGSKLIADREIQLPSHLASPRVDRPAPNGHAVSDGDVTMTDDADAGEMFPRQGTPPHLKVTERDSRQSAQVPMTNQSPAAADGETITADDESTDDDHDLDAPPRKSAGPQRSGTTAQARQHLASLSVTASPAHVSGATSEGRPIFLTPPKIFSSESSANPHRAKLGSMGGKAKLPVASENEPGHVIASPAKLMAKLGAMGGKSKVVAPSSECTPDPSPGTTSPSSAKPHKLGKLGGKKLIAGGASSANSRQPSEAPSAASTTTEGNPARQSRGLERRAIKEPTPPRENSQERADRKRLELKRQLDQTAAKGAAKKKRKF
ncbi:hypothetical protein LTR02_012378 [Friedmanniomyces endolithicus]|nr:hypothetical protein LTR94_003926 [Friedmanniomyces endolithicus]KAK0806682.1 hypothetical protein LTR38_005167 [Friedmanniomyces endolithicus]KAK0818658.1 hypothetical protein LTR75_002572 [Friedmanniomyces endolithicus]KAK0834267.1 hypothetical protein LTR03_014444 [Friedmanniomyces endolithicus]KAK0882899.1 hypothetical protein LTR87_003340 [Friedmanniomyces endolithicus]